MVSNDTMTQMESIGKEAAETRIEVISGHFPEVTDENHEGIAFSPRLPDDTRSWHLPNTSL
jgi:hypothetical protein